MKLSIHNFVFTQVRLSNTNLQTICPLKRTDLLLYTKMEVTRGKKQINKKSTTTKNNQKRRSECLTRQDTQSANQRSRFRWFWRGFRRFADHRANVKAATLNAGSRVPWVSGENSQGVELETPITG